MFTSGMSSFAQKFSRLSFGGLSTEVKRENNLMKVDEGDSPTLKCFCLELRRNRSSEVKDENTLTKETESRTLRSSILRLRSGLTLSEIEGSNTKRSEVFERSRVGYFLLRSNIFMFELRRIFTHVFSKILRSAQTKVLARSRTASKNEPSKTSSEIPRSLGEVHLINSE